MSHQDLLRLLHDNTHNPTLCHEAACVIEEQQAEIAALREASLCFAVKAVLIVKEKALLQNKEAEEWEKACGKLSAALAGKEEE